MTIQAIVKLQPAQVVAEGTACQSAAMLKQDGSTGLCSGMTRNRT